jgi:hypothetical protein
MDRKSLWMQALGYGSVWRRALRIGLSVGLLQAAVNQGDLWARGAITPSVVLKTIVSPLIGFTLVLFAAAETVVDRLRKEEPHAK